MNDVAALIEKFWLGTTKSLTIAAGHIFADIPESTQHIGFVVWKNFIYQHKFEQTVLFSWFKSYT